MDGFTFLRILMAKAPTPVIVVSSYSQRENVFKALELGALDFVPKPDRLGPEATEVRDGDPAEGAPRALAAAVVRPDVAHPPAGERGLHARRAAHGLRRAAAAQRRTARRRRWSPSPARRAGRARCCTSSASSQPTTAAAFLVAQHMPDKFTRTFAERLDKRGPVRTVEGQRRRPRRRRRRASCAPGASAWSSFSDGVELKLRVGPRRADDRYVPSADRLLQEHRPPRAACVGVILTGMGDDGVDGARAIREAGGIVIAESQETAVVNGMPGAAVRAGVASEVLPLPAIGDYLAKL